MADDFDQGILPADQTAAELEELQRRQRGEQPQQGSSVYVDPAGRPRITVGGSGPAGTAAPAAPSPVVPTSSPYDFDQSWAGTQTPPEIPPPEVPDPNARGDPTTIFLRAANAAGMGLPNRFVAAKQVLTGESPSYGEALANINKRQQQVHKEYPWTTGFADAGATTAATLGTLGLGGGSLFARGVPLPALWQRGVVGATEGATIGGLQGAGQTYSGIPSDYAHNFGMGSILGAGVGGAAPYVAAGVVGAGRAGADWLANKFGTRGALENAAAADRAGILNLPEGGMLPDAGPSMKGVAQGAVLGPGGPGKTALVDELTTRDQGTAPRVSAGVNTIYGPAPVPSRVQAGIQENINEMSPEYTAALNNAPPINARPTANFLDQQIMDAKGATRTSLRQIRGMLDTEYAPGTLDTDARAFKATRGEVRDMRDKELPDSNAWRLLNNTYKKMTEELNAKVPGHAELDARRAELGAQKDALDPRAEGAGIFDTGRGNVQRPVEFEDTLREAAQPKGVNIGPSAEPFRIGQAARAELDRIVGTKPNDLLALEQVIQKPWDYNAQKLALMFGPQRAVKMIQLLDENRVWRQTYQDVVQGSQTATRQAAQKAMEQGEEKLPMNITWEGVGARALQEAFDKFRGSTFGAVRDRIAQDLATRDPVKIRQLADELLNAKAKRDVRAEIAKRIIERGIKSSIPLETRP
jgi:hypothetical protein